MTVSGRKVRGGWLARLSLGAVLGRAGSVGGLGSEERVARRADGLGLLPLPPHALTSWSIGLSPTEKPPMPTTRRRTKTNGPGRSPDEKPQLFVRTVSLEIGPGQTTGSTPIQLGVKSGPDAPSGWGTRLDAPGQHVRRGAPDRKRRTSDRLHSTGVVRRSRQPRESPDLSSGVHGPRAWRNHLDAERIPLGERRDVSDGYLYKVGGGARTRTRRKS
jgi:hypothetical protein